MRPFNQSSLHNQCFYGHFLRGFVVNGKPDGKYHQYYSYAYNPCRWISLAGDCDRDKETAVSNGLIISSVTEMIF